MSKSIGDVLEISADTMEGLGEASKGLTEISGGMVGTTMAILVCVGWCGSSSTPCCRWSPAPWESISRVGAATGISHPELRAAEEATRFAGSTRRHPQALGELDVRASP